MNLAYFDLISGASGDMILGALVDAGASFEALRDQLALLHLPEFELQRTQVMRGAFAATKIDVLTGETVAHRHLSDVTAIIAASELPATVKNRATDIFRRIAEAEAGIHGRSVDEVHFHELGAVDTIVDITGALIALDLLGVTRVVASPIPLGRGLAQGAHGVFPLPAPATMALLQGAQVVGVDHAVETVTPTAAALLSDLAEDFGPIPAMQLTALGYGAGTRTTPEPNVLRVLLGEVVEPDTAEPLILLETNIDNMTGEWHGYVVERLLAAGALDAYLTPIIMKKGRPALVLSALCRGGDAFRLRSLIFAETTTLGIREQTVRRHCLARRFVTVATPYGEIRLKITAVAGRERAAPEYDDCRAAAEAHDVPLLQVIEAAHLAWGALQARAR